MRATEESARDLRAAAPPDRVVEAARGSSQCAWLLPILFTRYVY
jgi:hypothetical protein